MNKNALLLASLLAAWAGSARAAPPPPTGPAAAPGPADREGRMERHRRLARLMGLAEALDLDEGEALRIRGVFTRFDEKRAPIRQQLREQVELLRRAARGDAAAQKGVDDALKKMRELRGQVLALSDEMFQSVTQGLSADRRAKAALFMQRARARAMGEGGPLRGRMPRMGERSDRMERMGGPQGPGGGMGPDRRHDGGDRPDLEILGDEEL